MPKRSYTFLDEIRIGAVKVEIWKSRAHCDQPYKVTFSRLPRGDAPRQRVGLFRGEELPDLHQAAQHAYLRIIADQNAELV